VNNLPAENIRAVVYRQLVLTAVLTTLWLAGGAETAIAALIGGLAAALANAFFGFWVFSAYRAQQPGKLVGKIYLAEFAKLTLTGLIFLAAILLYVQDGKRLVAMLVTYFIVHVAATFLLAMYGRKASKS
jgi:F0F1-type ATP synthase assembly protein I